MQLEEIEKKLSELENRFEELKEFLLEVVPVGELEKESLRERLRSV